MSTTPDDPATTDAAATPAPEVDAEVARTAELEGRWLRITGPVAFRVPRSSVFFALILLVLLLPLAGGSLWFLVLYVVPVAIVVWVFRTQTVVDAEAVTVRRVFGERRVPWDSISSLRLAKTGNPARSRVRVVLGDDTELPLPAVHVRDLPLFAAASGGRLPDPAGQ